MIRRDLLPHLKDAKTKGHKTYLRYNKSIINNEIYKAADIEQKILM